MDAYGESPVSFTYTKRQSITWIIKYSMHCWTVNIALEMDPEFLVLGGPHVQYPWFKLRCILAPTWNTNHYLFKGSPEAKGCWVASSRCAQEHPASLAPGSCHCMVLGPTLRILPDSGPLSSREVSEPEEYPTHGAKHLWYTSTWFHGTECRHEITLLCACSGHSVAGWVW